MNICYGWRQSSTRVDGCVEEDWGGEGGRSDADCGGKTNKIISEKIASKPCGGETVAFV